MKIKILFWLRSIIPEMELFVFVRMAIGRLATKYIGNVFSILFTLVVSLHFILTLRNYSVIVVSFAFHVALLI